MISCADGFAAKEALERRGVYPEMADARHVVFICTASDTSDDLDRLEEALAAVLAEQSAPADLPPLPPARSRSRPSLPGLPASPPRRPCLSAGRRDGFSASQVAPYPPGIPVIAPGERIGKKTIAYLSQIGYNMEKDMEVVRL